VGGGGGGGGGGEGGGREPKVSAEDHYYYCPDAVTSPVMHKNWYTKYLLLFTDWKQLLVFVKCTMFR